MTTVMPEPVRLRLPDDEYYRMYDLGLIDVQDFEKSEIIDGELIRKRSRQPVRLRLSVNEYYDMYERGIIEGEDFERAEIINGELIPKMSIGDRHASVVDRLNRLLSRSLDDDVLVRIQNPLRLNDFDEPEPDVVLADLTKYDGERHPRPEETLVVIEVADTSLHADRYGKLPLYAKAGIREVWIVNLQADIIEKYLEVEAGLYTATKVFYIADTVISTAIPHLALRVDSILSKRS